MAFNGKEVLGKVKITAANAANTVADAANNVAKSAGDMMEVGKVNGEINARKKEIAALHEKIGEKLYQYPGDTVSKSEFKDDLDAIDAAYESLKELKLKSAELRGVKICSTCGKETDKENTFCPACGAKL